MGTFLAVSQITTLSLDLVDGALGVLDVGHEGCRHAARVPRHGDGVGGDAGGGERGEGRGVGAPSGRGEPQPRGDREEHRGVVGVPDCGDHGEYRHRHVPRPPHPEPPPRPPSDPPPSGDRCGAAEIDSVSGILNLAVAELDSVQANPNSAAARLDLVPTSLKRPRASMPSLRHYGWRPSSFRSDAAAHRRH